MPNLYCTTGSTSLGVVDAATGAVQTALTMGNSTNMVQVSPNGAYAAVTFQTTGVQFVTTAGNTVGPTITTGLTACFGLAWAPDSSKVYLQGQNAVQSCTPAGVLGPVWSVSGATNFSELAISPNGAKLYCPCGTAVRQVDTTSGATTATYTGFPNVYGVCVSPDGTKLYVTDGENPPTGGLYPVTIATGVVGTALAVSPYPYGMAISQDGATLWCAQFGGNQVQTIATATMTVTHTIAVPTANELAMTPNGATVWVGNFNGGTVVPVSTSTFTAGAPVTVGTQARGIGVQPPGQVAVAMAATTGMTVIGTAPPPIVVGGSHPHFVSGSAMANNVSNPTLTVPAPAGIVAGNLLLAVVGANGSGVVAPPSGWTLVDSHVSSDSDGTYLWSRTAGSSEPGSYTFTGGSWLAGTVLQYANAVIDGTVAWADFNSVGSNVPAATPTTASDTWLAVVYTVDGSAVGTSLGFTTRTSNFVTGLDGIVAADLTLTSSASTGTMPITITPSDLGTALTVLLKAQVTTDVVFAAGWNQSSSHSLMGSQDGVNWHTLANPNDLRAPAGSNSRAWGVATDGLGNVVLCGNGDASVWVISHSTDGGVTFTSSASPFDVDGEANGAIWASGLGLWICGGYNSGSGTNSGKVLATSPDMINWTARTTPFDGTNAWVQNIGWNGLLLVAVGSDNNITHSIMTSPDGITWTARTCALDDNYANGVWWDGTVWIVCGTNTENTATVVTSPDGVTWTTRSTPLEAGSGTHNAAGAIVCGDGASKLALAGSPKTAPGPILCTSTDHGVTWTARTTPLDATTGAPNAHGDAITWVAELGLWVLGGRNGAASTATICTSPDALSWTARTSPFDGTAINGSFGNLTGMNLPAVMGATGPPPPAATQLLAFGTDGNWGQVLLEKYNPTAGTWTHIATPWDEPVNGPGANFIKSGIYVASLGLFLLGGVGPAPFYPTLLSSLDGINWTVVPNPLANGAGGYITALVFGAGILVAGGWASVATDNVIMTSPDGATWTAHSSPLDGGKVMDVAWNGTAWLAVGVNSSGVGAAVTSTDGITWTTTGMPANTSSYYPTSVCWFSTAGATPVHLWVVGTTQAGASILTSGPTLLTNGSNWTSHTTFLGAVSQVRVLSGSLYATGHYQASNVGYDIAVSTDGINWGALYTGSNQGNAIFWDSTTNTAWSGAIGATYKSPDAQNWVQSPGLLDNGQVFGFIEGPIVAPTTPPPPATYVGTAGIIPVIDRGTSPGPSYTGLLFAVGAGGTSILSRFQNGSWSAVGTPWDGSASNGGYCGVWAGPPINKFFVGGGAGAVLGNPVLMSSPDGLTWSTVSTPFDGATTSLINNILWNGSLLVAVGSPPNSTTAPCILTSTDGVTWTGRTSVLGPGGGCRDVAWNGHQFLAVGTDASGRGAAALSADGITWSTIGSFPWTTTSNSASSVAWHSPAQRWVIVGTVSGQCFTSPDGFNWTLRSFPLQMGYTVRSYPPGLIATGIPLTTDQPIVTSPDGIAWTAQVIPPGGSGAMAFGGYFDGLTWWAGLGNGPGSNVLSSADAITWVPRTTPNSAHNLWALFSRGTPQPPPALPPAAPISFVSMGSMANSGSATSVTIPAPADIVAGNLLVVIIGMTGNTSAPAPTGWTSRGGGGTTTGGQVFVFTKVASGSEPASYVFAAGASTLLAGAMLQYAGATGVEPTGPQFSSYAAGQSAIGEPQTANGGDTLIFGVFGHGLAFDSTTPTGMITEVGQVAPSKDSIWVWDQAGLPAGPTVSPTTTPSNTSEFGAVTTILLHP